ncbi:hypothetical protein LEP1GSC016_1203 [Leptospira borgpetersenii serovar Hardjo-bovis str. Sponselee]|uniref:Uncharacterized protein n=2 Tax=Leptospira borgpetersenii TaxID=174 RepID=M6C416_LEPBO|nr:hypothetical protein LEP1GSC016_1203 [Leptospira borgpetersenii serovar Hardjo-bovis str. Sponselee]EMO62849.1 hypothetical protein LEP1GSC133_4242 [Leptospira borgpetersenii serovar Pomona str. 200901868]
MSFFLLQTPKDKNFSIQSFLDEIFKKFSNPTIRAGLKTSTEIFILNFS